MIQVYQRALRECDYRATRFLEMVSTMGGLATARSLLAKEDTSDGFTVLWERKRLDLSVEAQVLRKEFVSLFTLDERRVAADRLAQYGYEVKDA